MIKRLKVKGERLKAKGQRLKEFGLGVILMVAELPSSHKDTKLRRDKMPRLCYQCGMGKAWRVRGLEA